MSSTSGGAGDKPTNPNSKLKVNLQKSKNHSEWKVVQKKNNKSSNNTPSTPISPNLQHIIDRNPQLQLPSGTQFQFNDSNITHVNNDNDNIITLPAVDCYSVDMDLDNSLNNSCDKNGTGHATVANDHSPPNVNTMPDNTSLTYTSSKQLNSHGRDSNLIKFSDNFTGVPVIIIEAISDNNNVGKLHPMKVGKLFFNKFNGILRIDPIGVRVKVTFDSIISANICLSSVELSTMGLQAYIPSTLVYSFGVINLDVSFPEEDFWEGLDSTVQVVSFRRISTNNNGSSYLPSKMVDLKFLSPILPEKVAIYKVLFKVSPSIRSPVICQNCLRYGHTAKFCRGKANCSHCGLPDHSFSNCPTKESTVPSCFHCKGSHIATDRSCMEWSRQKNIKKIMATENVSYKDAVFIIKNNIVNKSSTFSDITAKPKTNDVRESSNNNIIISDETFPNIGESHVKLKTKNYNHNFSRKKNNPIPSKQPSHPVPVNKDFSFPNGTFLNYMSENTYAFPKENSWVSSLVNQLTHTLINDPASFSSHSSLNNIIESHIINFFSSIQNGSQEN